MKPGKSDAPYRPSVEDVELDIRRFLSAHDAKPDVPLQEMVLLEDIARILDDELVSSLSRVLEDAIYGPTMDDPDRMNDYYPAHRLLGMLRELQAARLRDAMQVKLIVHAS